uniref:YqgE/AlgH family protein n=1 Tax=Leersia perrieri TaxID=77586 RepID=A0A0D9WGM6_9ORYZ
MWALNLKAGGPCLTPRRPLAAVAGGEAGPCSVAAGRRLGRRGHALVAVGASGRRSKDGHGPGDGDDGAGDDEAKGNDDATSAGDSSDGLNQLHNESEPSEPINISNSNYWRDVRANLVRREQELLVDPSAPAEPKTSSGEPVHQLPQKWAHPITMPEAGCVLVATEVLDDDSIFERTVILLLRLGSRGTFDGPFGVILNRPLYTKIKHVNPSFQDQATPFGDSTLFFGGPVDMSMFLVRASDNSRLKGFEEVIPGIRFGFRTDLEKAAVLMKSGAIRSQDLRFFVGHAAWDYEQLLSEIRAGYWAVASCSTELISDALTGDPSCLWTEILQLMGGHYSELSQKPKQDDQ